MPYPAKAIANYFIDLAVKQAKPLSAMKLQKLIYFAHGWHLALTNGNALISEAVEAWKYGPVIKDIYHEFKDFGINPIDRPAAVLENGLNFIFPKVDEKDAYTKGLLNRIQEVYGNYTGIQLSNATHAEGSPWHTVLQKNGGELKKDEVIPNPLIQQYFTPLIKKSK